MLIERYLTRAVIPVQRTQWITADRSRGPICSGTAAAAACATLSWWLELPGGALGPPTDRHTHRLDVLHCQAPHEGHPWRRRCPAAALAMVFELVEAAQARWRAITGAHWSRSCGRGPARERCPR